MCCPHFEIHLKEQCFGSLPQGKEAQPWEMCSNCSLVASQAETKVSKERGLAAGFGEKLSTLQFYSIT